MIWEVRVISARFRNSTGLKKYPRAHVFTHQGNPHFHHGSWDFFRFFERVDHNFFIRTVEINIQALRSLLDTKMQLVNFRVFEYFILEIDSRV